MIAAERVPFVVIGENVHATRSYARQGRNVGLVDGVEHLLFRDVNGIGACLPDRDPRRPVDGLRPEQGQAHPQRPPPRSRR